MRKREDFGYDMKTDEGIMFEKNIITKVRYTTVECKFCGDWKSIVRYGKTAKGAQRYLCQKCRRTFVTADAPERMQYSTKVVGSAISLFYEGLSLHKIRRQLKLDYGVMPDHSTILKWIARYTKKAIKKFESYKPRTGETWIADETVLRLKSGSGEKVWLFDCIDEDTRFLLASHLTPTRYTRDAQTLMERAESRTDKVPSVVITDKLRSYLDAVERTWGADTRHHQASPFTLGQSTRSVERLHGTLKDRTKVMRSLFNRESARLIMDGWGIHYNFFRPHSGLKGKTPAQIARIDTPYKVWADIVRDRTST